MKMPSTIVVGPYHFTVSQDEKEIQAIRIRDNNVGLFGTTLQHALRIVIAHELHPDQEADTLLHEVLHCCWIAAGDNTEKDLTLETVIRSVSTILLDTLRRNPGLVKYLLHDDEEPTAG